MDTRRPRARRGEGDALRDEIVAAASGLIAASGDASTLSLRAVAREVGVATTSIYLHFPDLATLVEAVKTRRAADFGAALDAAAAAAGADPVDRLVARGEAYVRYGIAHPGHYRVLFHTSLLHRDGRGWQDYPGAGLFAPLIADVAIALGHHALPTDVHLVGTELWTALHGVTTLRANGWSFPFPPVDVHVRDLVARLTARAGATPS